MQLKQFYITLLFLAVLVFDVCMIGHITEKTRQINCFSYEVAYTNFRNHKITEEMIEEFMQESEGDYGHFSDLMTMYFASEGLVSDVELLEQDMIYAQKYHSVEFAQIRDAVQAVWKDLKCFPVGEVETSQPAEISFGDSWMQSRTFGGDRGHEGTDIMAGINQRGIYPIYSMTDGVVENIGWLKLGGYRIGIRSDSGAYFYYAHLSEYAREFSVGERVEAGTHLGYMGDTGYSEIPGTTGMFDVHLHLGIYLGSSDGTEYSVNSYPMLKYLWEQNAHDNAIGQISHGSRIGN